MISACFRLAFLIHCLLERHAPTNTLIRALRRGTGPPWLPVATLLAGSGYFCATLTCASILERGGPGWINLLALIFSWNTIKLHAAGIRATASHCLNRLLSGGSKFAERS